MECDSEARSATAGDWHLTLLASLPDEVVPGIHFGPTPQGYLLYWYHHCNVNQPLLMEQLRYHHCNVNQPLLLEQLREDGIDISAGQIWRQQMPLGLHEAFGDDPVQFAGEAAWQARLDALGITAARQVLTVNRIALRNKYEGVRLEPTENPKAEPSKQGMPRIEVGAAVS